MLEGFKLNITAIPSGTIAKIYTGEMRFPARISNAKLSEAYAMNHAFDERKALGDATKPAPAAVRTGGRL